MNKHVNVALFVPHFGCPHTCSFCNQRTISGATEMLTAEDIDAAVATAVSGNHNRNNSEIAFFGGSFTAIDRDYMISLLDRAFVYVKAGLFKGIRCSTRPDAIDEEILDILEKYGVTAIELGVQSMSDNVLDLNERGHSSYDVIKSSNLIHQFGFELGLQMMTGLYGDDDETDIRTAEELIALRPETVRIYPTVVLEYTTLGEMYKAGTYKPQTFDEAVNLCSRLLLMFHHANINVIRLGLHSGGNVENGYLAGAYHPAFREVCESRIYLDLLRKYILDNNIKGRVTIYVLSSEISKVVGQKKCNIEILKTMGIDAIVKGSNKIKKYDFYMENTDK